MRFRSMIEFFGRKRQTNSAAKKNKDIDTDGVRRCGICKLGDPAEPFVAACGHEFCRECLVKYFKSRMAEVKRLCCPYSGCLLEAGHADLTNLVGEEAVTNYKNYLLSAMNSLYRGHNSKFHILCIPCVNSSSVIQGDDDQSHREVQARDSTCCNKASLKVYAAMMDLDTVSRHYLVSWSSPVEDKTGKTRSTRTAKQVVWAKGTGFGDELEVEDHNWIYSARKREVEVDNRVKQAINSLMEALTGSSYLTVSLCAILYMDGILNRALVHLAATNDSILDIHISKRQDLYLNLIQLLDAMAPHPELTTVLSGSSGTTADSKGHVVVEKLETLYKQAKVMLHKSDQVVDGDLIFAKELCRCYEKLCYEKLVSGNGGCREGAELETDLKKLYIEKLRPFQFKVVSDAETKGQFSHYFRNEGYSIDKCGAHNHKRMLRIQKEIASLSTSLPLEWESSIHVCVDEERMNMLKALIVGPCGTPYQNGVFLFDIFLPSDYPQAPPKVQFLTTGGGTVRFNPNLYANGRVCLSLLGTWSGPGWVPGESTLLQVLISLQSLIFVKDPYYNEPGYEFQLSSVAELENMRHRENTLSVGILSALSNPELIFKDVILEHFRCKKQEIEQQCDEWVAGSEDLHTKLRISSISESIKSELRVLP